MADSLMPPAPSEPPQLPKAHVLEQARKTLAALDAFVRSQPGTAYQRELGWRRLAEVCRYLEWARDHQHEARAVPEN